MSRSPLGFQLKTHTATQKLRYLYSSLWVLQFVKCFPLWWNDQPCTTEESGRKSPGVKESGAALRAWLPSAGNGETRSGVGLVQDPKIHFKYFAHLFHLFLVCHWLCWHACQGLPTPALEYIALQGLSLFETNVQALTMVWLVWSEYISTVLVLSIFMVYWTYCKSLWLKGKQ